SDQHFSGGRDLEIVDETKLVDADRNFRVVYRLECFDNARVQVLRHGSLRRDWLSLASQRSAKRVPRERCTFHSHRILTNAREHSELAQIGCGRAIFG